MKVISDNAVQILHDGKPTLLGIGLPLPSGQVQDIECLNMTLSGENVPMVSDVRATWPDGSVRWCWCETIVPSSGVLAVGTVEEFPGETSVNVRHDSNASNNVSLPNDPATLRSPRPFVLPVPNTASIDAPGLTRVSLAALGLTLMNVETAHTTAHNQVPRFLDLYVILNVAGEKHHAPLTNLATQTKHSPLTHQAIVTGKIALPMGRHLNISLTLNACARTGEASLSLRIHNPRRAMHANGRWDLDDPSSCFIESFELIWMCKHTSVALHLDDDGKSADAAATIDVSNQCCEPGQDSQRSKQSDAIHCGSFSLTQKGSGGENWQSPIHWDTTRCSTVQARGFELNVNGNYTQGLRANPIVFFMSGVNTENDLNASSVGLAIRLRSFWQNFPMGLRGDADRITFQLFPQPTELQGGESKTWHFDLVLDQESSSRSVNSLIQDIRSQVVSQAQVRYNPDYLNACRCLPHLQIGSAATSLNNLIFRGITGKSNFFYKRERCDVYGWRHFGELWADHETALTPHQNYFISHYNNQYDPLMGMTLQYLHWGELTWLELIHPLSQHIQDIDIYDTQGDKPEYNGGLFWHTDHYLTAETSSHRSYSKYHNAAYEGYAGGGGPGGQHCYTTGLALQYWLFGDQNAKEKALQLCHWIRCFYNGNGSILDRTFRLATIDFKRQQLTNIGVKTPGFRYPLDRGTGNFINALLDAYELTNNVSLLNEVSGIIRQTIHPRENIAKRHLLDAENAWFYTVFLQAVVRYLCLKESLVLIDSDYWYGRHSFMHYATWMLSNEKFYLDTPDQLEFPNDTWCAQEIRKANLLCYGWYFAPEPEPEYLTRAEQYYQYISQRLSRSSESEYTRVLALLMQNDGVQQRFYARPRSNVDWVEFAYDAAPCFSFKQILFDYLKDIIRICSHFSIQREFEWLVPRVPKIFRIQL
ncbi:MAG: hypothetical protein P8176_09020 [Gammaproteobacteria bacterium]